MMDEAARHTDFPYRFAGDGLTARTDRQGYIRDLIEQLLFTRPGERLMRPGLGCGLSDLLFGPLGPEQVSAAQMTIQVALQEHMAREIEVLGLDVRAEDSALLIDITYRILETGEEAALSLTRKAAA